MKCGLYAAYLPSYEPIIPTFVQMMIPKRSLELYCVTECVTEIILSRSQCTTANNNNSHSFPHKSLRGPKGLLFGVIIG
ncbi:hypothetical protein NQ318_023447 [Aromia moschata]|uniref:Uncharacterized protein n=1 Tax=Aromia moschata TaxID=1265417 RepID=A0AAV8YL12_9CUCU|nr:hypothetical protein NQ318_023447 [Aromia moschata]